MMPVETIGWWSKAPECGMLEYMSVKTKHGQEKIVRHYRKGSHYIYLGGAKAFISRNSEAIMAEQRIKEAIANLTTVNHIRPNKLRKVVCKNGDVNWTEFQEALEDMVERNELQTEKQNGEEVILVSNTGGGADEKNVGAVENSKKKRKELTSTMEIPLAVAQHLTRKGRRKQKNIEQTCKSKLLLSGVDDVKSPRDNVTLQILNEYGAEDGLTEDESKQKASKQIKAAKVLVANMIKSFREHPDRFTFKMAGGTLDEQAKAKKIREKGAKLRAGKQQQKRGATAGDGSADDVPNKKKKKRKFY